MDLPTLAVGAQGKSTFALGRGGRAILSHHLGDLDHVEARRTFERDVALYEDLFDLRPARFVCDAHPDYASTAYARARAEREGAELLAVQHHHAHMASCMAEHGLRGPVIGVSFDGTGFGLDGAVWGGEFLVGDLRSFQRVGHFEYVPMPGGEAAVREPWRMALSYLTHAGEGTSLLEARIPGQRLSGVRAILRHGLNSPRTSSAGRLFDGVAALLGLADRVSYEGQAAMRLEQEARSSSDEACYPVDLDRDGDGWIVRIAPLISAILRDLRKGVSRAAIARRFHSFVVEAIRHGYRRARTDTGVDQVTLSGGVFMNAIVLSESCQILSAEGFRVFRHERVPSNDGGISFGQLAVAAAREADGSCA
jgi:hydrogenase maturation protein HypF